MTFCDFLCVYAKPARSELDGGRSCMTFTAIYCELHDRHVAKAQPCREKIQRDLDRTGEDGGEKA
ncbi:MAG: hypothetical protein JSV26_00435 [bacterium]|nr:MAG: hypothetical protein JSV26_00435 [bacterium]